MKSRLGRIRRREVRPGGAIRRTTVAAFLPALVAGVLATAPGATAERGGGQETGTIAGRVTVTNAPEPRMVEVTADQQVCGDEVEDRAVVVDGSGGLANAVILVAGVPWGDARPEPVIDNAGCHFVPRVQVAPTRSVLTVRSADDVLHTTHAYDDRHRTLFNIAIPFPGLEIERPLRRPGPVRVECDSHGWMRGWIYVTDDIGTVSGAGGRYELTGIPPGTYDLTVWHERYDGATRQVTVTAGGTAAASFTLE